MITMKKSGTKSILATTALASTLFLSGCVTGPGGGGLTNDQASAITGTIVGAALGDKFGEGRGRKAMRLLGAALGGYIGAQMSAANQQKVYSSLNNNSNNQATSWSDNSNRYTVTPTSTFQGNVNGHSSICRTYKMDAWIDGRLQQVNGRACKNAAGQWVAAS